MSFSRSMILVPKFFNILIFGAWFVFQYLVVGALVLGKLCLNIEECWKIHKLGATLTLAVLFSKIKEFGKIPKSVLNKKPHAPSSIDSENICIIRYLFYSKILGFLKT